MTNRLWLPIAALILLAGNALLGYFVLQDRDARLRAATETARSLASVTHGRLHDTLDTMDRTLSGIGEALVARNYEFVPGDLTAHRLLLRRHAITPGLHWLFLLTPDGRLAETSTAFPAPEQDLSDRDYFRAPANDWERELYVGAPLLSRLSGSLFIPLSRRIVNDGGRFLGVAAAGLDPAVLERQIEEQGLPPHVGIVLALRDGTPLLCLPTGEDCANLLRELAAPPPGDVEGAWVTQDARRIVAGSAEGAYPVNVRVTVSVASVVAAWRHDAERYFWLVLLGDVVLLLSLEHALRQARRRREALDALAQANAGLERRVRERTLELALSEARARLFMNTANDAVLIFDHRMHIIEANQAAELLFGYPVPALVGRPMVDLLSGWPDSLDALLRMPHAGLELRGRRREGDEVPVEVSTGSAEGQLNSLHVAVLRDISERLAARRELERLATTDALTGLANRRAFVEQGEQALRLAQRHRRPLSALMLDVDHFKSINDNHGHPVGDAVLRALGACLSGALRTTDLCGRLGGEEFGLLLPETGRAEATQLAGRLLDAVRALRIPLDSGELRITVSIGLTESGDGDSLEALLRRADLALYAAKRGGRDRLEQA